MNVSKQRIISPVEQLRKKKRLGTRRRLAVLTGLSYETLCRYERGLPVKMSANVAESLSRVLDIEASWLQQQYRVWKQFQQL